MEPTVMTVKETKEALVALIILGKLVADAAKDGLQLNDAVELAQKLSADPALAAKLKAGVEGMDKIPAEIKDISLAEGIELCGVIPELLKALK